MPIVDGPFVELIPIAGKEAFVGGVATAVNAHGVVAGVGIMQSGAQVVFKWYEPNLEALDPLTGTSFTVTHINDNGLVTGALVDEKGMQLPVIWTDTGAIDFRQYGIQRGIARDVNNDNAAAGSYLSSDGQRAFLWTQSGLVQIETLGGNGGYAVDINERGFLVGASRNEMGLYHAFVYSDSGGLQDLGVLNGGESWAWAINDRGVVVGGSTTGVGRSCTDVTSQCRAVMWRDGSITDLGTLGGGFSVAKGVNESNEVVGISETSNGDIHGFLYRHGRMLDIGTLGGAWSEAVDITDMGLITGSSESVNGEVHGFVWQFGGIHDLGTVGGAESTAFALNEIGHVVGGSRGPVLWRTQMR